ncbi:hypothetical protein LOTGIDRAFT_200474 [Lottia gigantea]|uniref:Tryptophan--tRNA ligase, mitochondrial n=1 Tax=Lottia gigantea TaxID=225164 RepID=V4CG83_LOTGI|nr:hypothetical protein LOTGIDRAFT_200474 [Lottia gigantea]ESP01075.1 hypothetical protein LOTGIDRAFT_200474 [Lottia gigantea]
MFRKAKKACTRRVFSGIQPTGIPHIGNYVGAIKNWLQLQKKYDSMILSVVDLHSITLPQNPETLRENIYDMTACLLACGIDSDKCILFQQSTVPQHTQLAWILGCICTLPRLEHLAQWKEKSEKNKDVGTGLLTYPILQSADILLYKATDVPVGKDQIQHIELSRDLAKSFNTKFGVLFPKPQELLGPLPKIKSLKNPKNKMSKSEINPMGRIDLTDEPDQIREKIKKAVTDSTSEITYDPENRPGVANLIEIHEALTGDFAEDICETAMLESMDTHKYKLLLTDIVIEKLKPIREEFFRLQKDRHHLDTVLEKGRLNASEIAEVTYKEVTKLVGFR